MVRIFQILAVVLVGVAAFFLWRDNGDGAFVSVVLACSAFFLSIRYQAQKRVGERIAERIDDSGGETDELSAKNDFESAHHDELDQNEDAPNFDKQWRR